MRVLPTRTDTAISDAPKNVKGERSAALTGAPRLLLARLRTAWMADWHGPRIYAGALLIVALSALTVAAFYINHPAVNLYGDTHTYVGVARRYLNGGPFLDELRAPGYPLLIAAIFAVAGTGNLTAVQNVQAMLFVLTALEAYALAYMVLRRTWMACALGLLVGCNILLISYFKPILSEALTIFLVMTLALLWVRFAQSVRARDLWLVAAGALALYLTRLEWSYLAALLFGLALYVAWQRGRLRALLPHALGATLVLYALVGAYIVANGFQTGYRGLTVVQNINLLGKVMQYHMQDEAPPQYAEQAAIVDSYVRRGIMTPWPILHQHPEFARDHYALAGAYATAVVKAHPVEFAADSLPLLVTTLAPSYLYAHVLAYRPLAGVLVPGSQLFLWIHGSAALFPLVVLLLLGLLLWRRTRARTAVQAAAGVALLVVYDLVVTSYGTYTDYPRLHSPFDPLILLLVWGTLLVAADAAFQRWARPRLARRPQAETVAEDA